MPRRAVRFLPLVLAVFASSASAQTSVVTHIGYVFPSISQASLDSSRAGARIKGSDPLKTVSMNVASSSRQSHVAARGTARVEVDGVQTASLPDGHQPLRFDFFNAGDLPAGVMLAIELRDSADRVVSRQKKARGLFFFGGPYKVTF